VAWATEPSDQDPVWCNKRLSVVRGFAKHVHDLDPLSEVPPADLLPVPKRRATPYLYSPAEIVGLMLAARAISSPLKAATYETLVGLLAATGMRVGEAIRLNRDDLDLDHELLTVVQSKFGKSREIPLHPSTVLALRDYAHRRDELCPHAKTPSFLVSTAGTRLIPADVRQMFGASCEPLASNDVRRGAGLGSTTCVTASRWGPFSAGTTPGSTSKP
jgi:integrase/recombinase XerD